MVVHTSANVSHDQVLATKPGAWRLVLSESAVTWRVKFGSDEWVAAVGPALHAGAWVVKATVAAPTIRLHLCELLTVDEPGSATLLNRCNITEVASANASAAASLATVVAPNITFGGEFSAGGAIEHGLVGALEEIFISRVDTSGWTRYNWNVPPTGITDFFSTQHCLQHLCASQCLTRSSLSARSLGLHRACRQKVLGRLARDAL